ncbi:hypothetical protein OH77DRAFT_1359869, partial [Trametes cingulata]
LTGIPHAHMSWTTHGYAKLVVIRYGYKLVGWPIDVPFRNLSNLPGGAQPLLALRAAWNARTLRFEPATRVDLVNAARDPASVSPDRDLLPHAAVDDQRAEDSASATPPPEGSAAVAPHVLHPGTLRPLGIHPSKA